MNHPRPSLFEQNPVAWYDGALAQSRLTLQDKLQLNRRAKKHGLPTLWPEAEEEAREERGRKERALLAEAVLRQEEERTWRMMEQQQQGLLPHSFITKYERDSFSGVGLGRNPHLAGWTGDPVFGRNQAIYCAMDPAWPPAFDTPSLLSDVGRALRSFFSRFRGPIPW